MQGRTHQSQDVSRIIQYPSIWSAHFYQLDFLFNQNPVAFVIPANVLDFVRIANASGVPIAFADLSDEELDMVFDRVINETLADVQEPFSGWMRIWKDLTESISMFLGDGNGSSSESTLLYHFLSSLCVLLTTPIALLRNVLVLIMEAPFSNTAWLLLIFIAIPAFLLTQTDVGTGGATSSSGADGLLNLASLLLTILGPSSHMHPTYGSMWLVTLTITFMCIYNM